MGPPVAQAPWSTRVPVQTIEIIPVGLEAGRLFWLKPVHADSLRVPLPLGTRPADLVLEVIGWYPLDAVVVHSTSWRHEDAGVLLTYLVVVQGPIELPSNSLIALAVERAELSRGGARSAPATIDPGAVIEHALRHLAWLHREDPAVRHALGGWEQVLAGYEPEPFRALSG